MSREGVYGKVNNYRQSEHPKDPREWGAKCDSCPLKGATPVWGDGPRDAVLAFVGEAPGRDEVSIGLPFVGRSGQTWENWLSRHNLNRRQVWVDNAIMCFPPGGDMKLFLQREKKVWKSAKREWQSPVDCCRPRLMRALKVPLCKCGKWMRGPNEHVCLCRAPKWLKVYKLLEREGHRMPVTTMPMGNYAMEAVLGFGGITQRRGYVEDMKARRERMLGLAKEDWQRIGRSGKPGVLEE